MADWIKAFRDQTIVRFAQVLSWRFWIPLLLGLVVGLLIGDKAGASQGVTSGWVGIIAGALLGAVFAIVFDWVPKEAGQVVARKPLNHLLGPLARETTTVYVGPFARPLDSRLLRLDRTLPFDDMPAVLGTELVVGLGDTIALSFIYATLLKSGKRHTDILINQNADLERGKWGMNFFSIGVANARTREVLGAFKDIPFTFEDEFRSIVVHPKPPDVIKPVTIDGQEVMVRYQNKVRCNGSKDYGVILKLRDEARDEGNRIFIVAGLGGDGTAGAAFYLWHNYKELATKADTFGVLIETAAGYESARLVEFDDASTSVVVGT